MKKETIEALGLQENESVKGEYFIPYAGWVKINDDTTAFDIFRLIYLSGIEEGTNKGKRQRSEEFRKLLNIDKY